MRFRPRATYQLLPFLFAAWTATGCGLRQPTRDSALPSQDRRAVITGNATTREGDDVPRNAVLEVSLEDVSRPNAPATLISRSVIADPSDVPIPFSVSYDSGQISPVRKYAVRARLLVDGDARWLSERAYPVLTQGSGRSVDIVMRRIGSHDDLGDQPVIGGELAYVGDVAYLTECTTRRIYPIALERDFRRMRLEYVDRTRDIGAPLYVTFEGTISDRRQPVGGGSTPTIVVSEFIGAWPNQSCARSRSDAALFDTRWRLTSVNRQLLVDPGGREEPHVVLTDNGSFSASAGCNGLGGSFTVQDETISFGAVTATRMSCGDRLDALERRLLDSLDRAARWRVFGNTLELLDGSGTQLALFEAAPMR
jgi:putative lipoprotein